MVRRKRNTVSGYSQAPTSLSATLSSESTVPTTPAKAAVDVSKEFPLQFGSISPGFMNGMQIPARTSSAPPNLDEQKRDQARHDSSRPVPNLPTPVPKQQLARKDVDQSIIGEAHQAPKAKKKVQVSPAPPASQSPKSSVLTIPMTSMQMPFHPPQVSVQFGGPNPQIQEKLFKQVKAVNIGRETQHRKSGQSANSNQQRSSSGVYGRDLRLILGFGGNIGFRPGQGGNFDVLRNPRAQTPMQYARWILSGPMQSMGSQRAANFQQKGLIPSPQTPLEIMHKAERKYEVGKVTDEEEAKQRQLKAILNKLTTQNFEKLFEQVKVVNIDNAVTLTGVISQIFDTALMEPNFCEMCANFCCRLAGELPDFSEDNEKITFKRLLLNKCQEEFERGEREQEEANKVEEEGEVKQSGEEREEKRIKARRRMLGNIRLLSELYKKRMLTEIIMHECIKKLLDQYQNPDEEDIEVLCKLMSTIGEMIDNPKAKGHMDFYFDRMAKLSKNMKLSSRVRFMLKDAIDLRKNKWQQRKKVEGPKKIEEVHRDAAQERPTQASADDLQGDDVASREVVLNKAEPDDSEDAADLSTPKLETSDNAEPAHGGLLHIEGGRDLCLILGFGGNMGLRPCQGGNFGVLRNPRAQTPMQYTGGILSGPMQSMGSQGGMARNSPDADRWQCAANFQQKGLIPSPQTPLEIMHKAERKYEVGKVTDEEEAKQRQLKAILNKLTLQNFEKLFEQVKAVNIDNAVTLTGVISQIFDTALMEPNFCEMYANFCCCLAGELPDLSEDNKKITFKRLLLNKCQEEFERGEREQEEANKVEEEGEVKQSEEEREEKRIKARRRMLGNIRLIGELYKKRMLTERIMHACIKKLLGQYQNPDEEDIKALCILMSTIGEMIDHPKAKEHMDFYFDSMAKLSNNMKLSSRVKFMLKDAIDLRKNKWQQRKKVDGPKKIEEVHRDAAQEQQRQASADDLQGDDVASGEVVLNKAEPDDSEDAADISTPKLETLDSAEPAHGGLLHIEQGRDLRLILGFGGNIGFRPCQGGNFGVLRNPRAQTPMQYTGGILSGPMQSMGSQEGMARNSPDADRWQRAANFQQKGLVPSPQTPLEIMHKAERKSEVGKVTDEEEAKQRQLKAILNKLTPQNFEKLFEQVKAVNIDNAVTLIGVISQIFDKALMEPNFCEMYVNFCYRLAGELPDFSEDNEKITFKRLLVNKCQEEFERGDRDQEEANKVEEEGEVKQSEEEREEKRIKARRRMLGNIRLIGELYKKRMLTERIMHACIKKLLGQYQNPDEEDIEALCILMSTIGEMIDHLKAKEHMDFYFDSMAKLSNNMKLSSRVRFMLKDAIDLRKNKWQQRRKVEGPKKIDEVHRDTAQEQQTQASADDLQGDDVASGELVLNKAEPDDSEDAADISTPKLETSDSAEPAHGGLLHIEQGEMSATSSVNQSSRTALKFLNTTCNCGIRAAVKISNSKKNKNKLYYCCGNDRKCRFWSLCLPINKPHAEQSKDAKQLEKVVYCLRDEVGNLREDLKAMKSNFHDKCIVSAGLMKFLVGLVIGINVVVFVKLVFSSM